MYTIQICNHHLGSFHVSIHGRQTTPLPASCSNQATYLFREGANIKPWSFITKKSCQITADASQDGHISNPPWLGSRIIYMVVLGTRSAMGTSTLIPLNSSHAYVSTSANMVDWWWYIIQLDFKIIIENYFIKKY